MNKAYRLGQWTVDPSRNLLCGDDAETHVEARAMDALNLLAANAPYIVSIDDLIETLWPRTHADSGTLHRLVSKLRRALGDSPSDPQYIETVPKRGYRIVAGVHSLSTGRSGGPGSGPLPFVGREAILGGLQVDLAQMMDRKGRIVLLTGPPGIGKSRTAQEFLENALGMGALIVAGRCNETGTTPPYWPWTGILRGVHEVCPLSTMPSTEQCAEFLSPLVPEIVEAPADQQATLAADEFRFKTSDAVCQVLKHAAAIKPLVLFLDDLHRADESSLVVLEFIAHEIATHRMLIVGTYRDVEVSRTHPISNTLASLARTPIARRCEIGSFSRDEVSALFESSGSDDDKLLTALNEKTDGNPLYATLLIETWESGGAANRIPTGLREVLLGRLSELSTPCNRLLAIAAVVGRNFDTQLLSDLCGIQEAESEDLLDEARRVGIVTFSAQGTPRFAHLLIQEVVYNLVVRSRRIALHLEIASQLANTGTTDGKASLEAAFHFANGAEPVDAARWYQKAFVSFQHRDDHAAYRCCIAALDCLDSHRASAHIDEHELAIWTCRTAINALFQAGPIGIDRAQAANTFERAQASVANLSGYEPLVALLNTTYSDYLTLAGQPELALRYAEDALALQDSNPDEATRLHAVVTLVGRLKVCGRNVDAYEIAAREVNNPPSDPLVSIARQRTWYPFPRILRFCGEMAACFGEPQAGLVHIEEAIRLLRKDGAPIAPEDVDLVSDSLWYRGVPVLIQECIAAGSICYFLLGDRARAKRCARNLLASVEKHDSKIIRAGAFRMNARILAEEQDWTSQLALYAAFRKAFPEPVTDLAMEAYMAQARAHTGEKSSAAESVLELLRSEICDTEPQILICCMNALLRCADEVKSSVIEGTLDRLERSIADTGYRCHEPALNRLRIKCGRVLEK